jgi:hypothetical protein
MDTDRTSEQSIQINQHELLVFVRGLLGGDRGRPDDEHPLPPGPWDPVIRRALERVIHFGPDPWQAIGSSSILDRVGFNPQPLSPRVAFAASIAQAMVDRAELIQEVADVARIQGAPQGIIIGGYINHFVDDFCGNDFRLKFPFPGPRPGWFSEELDGIDLVVMGAQFEQAAKQAYQPEMQRALGNAAEKLVQQGLSRVQ